MNFEAMLAKRRSSRKASLVAVALRFWARVPLCAPGSILEAVNFAAVAFEIMLGGKRPCGAAGLWT